MLPTHSSHLAFSITTTVDQIKKYQLSPTVFDRHIQTRIRIMKLFLHIALIDSVETLCAISKLPFAAVKVVFDKMKLGRLPPSFSFDAIADHLKRSRRYAKALAFDFPALILDPSQAQTRLVDHKPTDVNLQSKPTPLESLLKHAWTPQAITLIGVVIAAVVLHRLGFLAYPSSVTSPHEKSNNTHPSPPDNDYSKQNTTLAGLDGSHWVAPLAVATILGFGVFVYIYRNLKSQNGAHDLVDPSRDANPSVNSISNRPKLAPIPSDLRPLLTKADEEIWNERKSSQQYTVKQTAYWTIEDWFDRLSEMGMFQIDS